MRYLLVMTLFFTACMTEIGPGNVGVSVRKCGNNAGVSPTPIPVGYYSRSAFCEEVIEYPTSLQTLVLCKAAHEGSPNDDSITVTSSEGMPINVDVSMSFTLDPGKVPRMYEKYRSDLDHIKETFVRQTIREALQATYAKYTAEQLYSDKREISRAEAQKFLIDKLVMDGFIVNQFTVNETRVPAQVQHAIEAKVAMIQDSQKSEQEVRKIKAQAEQRVAEAEGQARAKRAMADAEAYYNDKLTKSLSPQLVQYEAIKKWNGTLPTMTGSGSIPFVQVKP